MKTAVIIGASGLVGSHLCEQLLASPHYSKVILLNRRPTEINHSKLEEKIIDFENPDLKGLIADDVFCAIGTTIKKAGSKEAQYKIDCKYPSHLASILKEQGAKQFLLVSSIGANAASTNFYLRTKGELENNIKAIGFETSIIVRPSFILGQRKEFRLGEKIGIVMMRILSPLMLGSLKKYRGVKAEAIAAKLITSANSGLSKHHIIESDAI